MNFDREFEMAKTKDSIDPFIDMLIDYVKSGSGYIRDHDVLYLCDIVERSRFTIKKTYGEVCTLVATHMKTDGGLLDRHKQGACFMVAVMDGLCVPEDLNHLEVYRTPLVVCAGMSMVCTLFSAEEGVSLLRDGKIRFPDKIRDCGGYEFNLAYRLWVAGDRCVDREVLALFLASELFFIESHNRNLGA